MFVHRPFLEQHAILAQLRGGKTMFKDIQKVLSESQFTLTREEVITWTREFSRLEILLAVRASLQDGEDLCFDVLEDGQLQHTQFQNIRVLAYDGEKWMKDVKSSWELKVYNKKPLSKLQ